MPNEQDNEEVLVIPTDMRERVGALVRRHELAKISHECAIARYHNAVDEGNVNLAITEFDAGKAMEMDLNDAVEEFWACIQGIFPEANKEAWKYDSYNFTLARRDAWDMLESSVRRHTTR